MFSCDSPEPVESLPEVMTCDSYALTFKNYLNNSQNIHPKVIKFPHKWNGYKLWMAYTPYPFGITEAENPCIAVSNDGLNWEASGDDVNPLALAPENGYNSDTHLVYDEKGDMLECWYRGFDTPANADYIVRRRSRDGVNWGKVEMMDSSVTDFRLSPAVSIIGDKYHCVYSDGKRLQAITAEVAEVETAVAAWRAPRWSEPVELPLSSGLRYWHHDMLLEEDGWADMVICAFLPGNNNNSAALYYYRYCPSTNEVTDPELIVGRQPDLPDNIFSSSLYRSSFIQADGRYYIYLSSIDLNNRHHLSVAWGKDVHDPTFMAPGVEMPLIR